MAAATPDERTLDDTVEALEQRVQRLEQAVAAMSDTHLMEDRVVERVARRIEPHQNGGLLSGAARLFKGGARKAEPEGADPAPEIAASAPAAPPPLREAPPSRPGWLVLEFIHEVRAAARMFADYRYRMSWTGRLVPIICIIVAVMSFFVFRIVPIVGTAMDYLVDIVLVVIVYKALSREVQRYQSGAGRVLR
jgi:hypothetical protein